MSYYLNPNSSMGNVPYYPNYEQSNYICAELNYIDTELNNVNQRLCQLLPMIQRGLYDEIFNPNGYNGCTAFTHNCNEYGNGQGMKKGRANDREFHFLSGYKMCLENHKTYLENRLINLKQCFNFPPYNNNLLW